MRALSNPMKMKKLLWVIFLTVFITASGSVIASDSVSFIATSDWGSGFVANMTVTNNTDAVSDGWQVEFDFPYEISSVWSAVLVSHVGDHYIVENASWNGSIQPGSSITFGLQGTPGNVTSPTNIKCTLDDGEPTQPDPPVANNDTASTEKNTPVEIDVLQNDTGDNITLSSVSDLTNGTAQIVNGKINYTPKTDFAGNDTFSYTIKDSAGQTASANVVVTVEDNTQPPAPTEGFEYKVTGDWGSGFNGSITLTNLTGQASDRWTVEFDYPYNITQIWNAEIISHSANHYVIGNLSWNGAVNSNGSVSFGFGASPGNATINPSNVSINMNSGEEPEFPAANSDSATVQAGSEITVNALSNDTGNGIQITSITQPQNGNASFTSNSITYAADDDFSGNDSLQYTITDSNGNSDSATVTIAVTAPPVIELKANSDNATTYEDTAKIIDVLANDTGDQISITAIANPQNGTVAIENNNVKYTPVSGFTGSDSFQYTITDAKNKTATATVLVNVIKKSTLSKVVVGYWHNWTDTTSGIRLKDVPSEYNVIDVSFAEPVSYTDMTMKFNLDTNIQSEAEFIQDIKDLQAQGRKVLISIGGANAHIRLNTETDRDNFANSMIQIVEKYGFDGIDIDFEGGAFSITNSASFKNPTSSLLVNAIDAVKTIVNHFKGQGKDFWLTAAPETYYLQAGISVYGGTAGSYIPFLYALKDDLNFVAPQLYNSGSMIGLDGKAYNVGTPDFIVAMTEMLMKGFTVGSTGETFQLRPDQVVVGLPATTQAAGSGYQATENVLDALNYLTKGESFGGSYQLQSNSGYSDMRGIMTWSINWDKTNSYEFATTYYDYFYSNVNPDNKTPVVNIISPVNGEEITMDTLSPVAISVESSDEDGYIAETTISVDGSSYSGTSASWTPSDFGIYSITAIAKDNEGAISTKTIQVTVKQNGGGGEDENISPTLSFNYPLNNSVIKQSSLSPISISVLADDEDGSVESTTITVGNTVYDSNNVSWTPESFDTYTIQASATDDKGAVTTALISVTVQYVESINNTKKQIIGYFTQWDAWKSTNVGFPAQGVCNQLNVDYSKYTILNYSFFGVAKDGSLHGADYRNKLIYQEDQVQEPAPMLYGDVYSSWDYWLLYGELDLLWEVNDRAMAAGFTVEGNGWSNSITGLTGDMPIPMPKEGGAPGLLKLCKDNNVKLMASIGGWSMCKHFPEMAADPAKKQKFLVDCSKLMAMGFDGIDIDWEYPGFAGMNYTGTNADFANFTALMRDIRNTIGADKLITAAFSCSPEKLEYFEWSKLNEYVDYYNIMSYDMDGGWSEYTGHNSPLYAPDNKLSWNRTFKYLTEVKGIAPGKINMGLGFYGRGVVTQDSAALGAITLKTQRSVNPDGPVSTAADYVNWGAFEGTPNFGYIKQKEAGWTYHWDDYAKVPYLTKGNYFLSFDDESSIQCKADYVVENNIGGVIVWHVFGDWEVDSVDTLYGNKLPYCSNVNTPLLNILHYTFETDGDASHL